MTTKQLLTLSIVAVFLTGVAMGYSLNDALHAEKKLVPQNSREQLFAAEVQRERLSTTGKADTMRVDTNAGVRDFVYGLSQAARSVTQGASPASVQTIVDTRVAALAGTYATVLNNQDRSQYQGLWKDVASTVLQYAQAKAANRPDDQAATRQTITTASNALADWYTQRWTALNASQIRAQLNSGAADLISAVDVASSGTSLGFLNSEQRAATTLAKSMDTISAAVVSQSPSAF